MTIRNHRTCLAVLALAFAVSTASAAEKAETVNLDQALSRQAPAIIKYLREKKYTNVGVLKFLVQKGEDPPSDNAGPLNLSIANRLEVALALANPDEDLGIIERASTAVARANNKRANHRTKEGRQALFNVKYTLGWGNQEVSANAFVTGLVVISPNLRTLTVTVQAFGKQSADLDTVCKFTATANARTLAEAGESYLLKGARGAFDDATLLVKADESAADIKSGKEDFPLEAKESPVELKIVYGGEEARVSKGKVREPKEGQEVTFVLKNKGTETYGVVLMVNGENTIYRERLDPASCYKWILDPGEEIKVRGYQTNLKEFVKFTVLSPEESAKNEMNYNEHAGTFSLIVFRNKKKDEPPVLVKDDAVQELAAISRGSLTLESKPNPSTLKALQSRLKKRESNASDPDQRGYVVPGQKTEGSVKQVSFKADPIPVMSCTIRYYEAKGGK